MDNIYLPSRAASSSNLNISENPPLGLDFGTTNSVLAHFTDEIHRKGAFAYSFPLLDGSHIYPSILYYDETSDTTFTGLAAKVRAITNPEGIITSIKREISKEFIKLANKKLYPVDIASRIIAGLFREIKSTELNLCPSVVTMTVPYYFKQAQNILLQDAAERACEEVFGCKFSIKLIPEPVAAAIDYIYSEHSEKNLTQTILIYDIGGGTCDVTIVKYLLSGSSLEFEVLGIDGDGQLGGDDIDQLFLEYICNENDIDIDTLQSDHKYTKSLAILKDAIRGLKENLSIQQEGNLIIPSLFVNDSYINIDIVVSRREFTNLLSSTTIKGRNETVFDIINAALNRLKTKTRNITVDALLPIGGTSCMPAIQQLVQQKFPNSRHIFLPDKGNQVSVARGAAIVSALKDSRALFPLGKSIRNISIIMRVPHTLSVAMYDGSLVKLIEANSPAPSRSMKTFYATRLDSTGRYIELPSINLYQGEGNSIKSEHVQLVGKIDLSSYHLHAHGRKLSDIPFQITFSADATSLTANIVVSGVNADKTDLIINKKIQL